LCGVDGPWGLLIGIDGAYLLELVNLIGVAILNYRQEDIILVIVVLELNEDVVSVLHLDLTREQPTDVAAAFIEEEPRGQTLALTLEVIVVHQPLTHLRRDVWTEIVVIQNVVPFCIELLNESSFGFGFLFRVNVGGLDGTLIYRITDHHRRTVNGGFGLVHLGSVGITTASE